MTHIFGPFRLDTTAGELRRGDQRVRLTPKVFRLLLLLVQNPERLIAKREILDEIWGDTHVEEGSVTRAITALRSALNDNASRPEYVQTVPRRGYRFVAAVQKTASAELASRSAFQIVAEGRGHPLIEGENTLGRAADCEVSLKLASISRRHAVIAVNGTRITLRDLGSKNGTFVNGRRVDAVVELREGDEIRLGPVALKLASGSADPSTVTETRARHERSSKK